METVSLLTARSTVPDPEGLGSHGGRGLKMSETVGKCPDSEVPWSTGLHASATLGSSIVLECLQRLRSPAREKHVVNLVMLYLEFCWVSGGKAVHRFKGSRSFLPLPPLLKMSETMKCAFSSRLEETAFDFRHPIFTSF